MDLSKKQTVTYLGILIFMISIPLVVADYPHLLDLPNHLARIKIIVEYPTNLFYQELYDLNFDFIPNLALDIFALQLEKYFPILVIGKMFIGVSLVTTLLGVIFLNYTIYKKVCLWPFFSSIFLYNYILQLGFVNYLMGIGLTFWGISIYIKSSKLNVFIRFFLCFLIGVVLFFCHIISFSIFIVFLISFELSNLYISIKNHSKIQLSGVLISCILLSLLLFYSFYFLKDINIIIEFIYRGFLSKILLFFGNLSWSNGVVDGALIICLISMLIMVILGKGLIINSRLLFTLITIIVFYFILPVNFGNGWHFDTRIPLFIILFFMSVTVIKTKLTNSTNIFAITLVGILAVRSFFIIQDWKINDKRINAILEQVQVIPNKSTLVIASDLSRKPKPYPYGNREWLAPRHHSLSYAILGKTLFIPNIWANNNQHTLSIKNIGRPLYQYQGNQPIVIKSSKDLLRTFKDLNVYKTLGYSDVYIALLRKSGIKEIDCEKCNLVSSNDDISIYKVRN